MNTPDHTERVVNSVCTDHCSNACVLKFRVKEGRLSGVETDKDYRACVRGRSYRQLVCHRDRILYPLKRVGGRGEGKWERITWDEALDTVLAQYRRVRAEHGARSVILLCSAGDQGYLHYHGLIDRILVRMGGYTGVLDTVSNQATNFAAQATYGVNDSLTANSHDCLRKSRLVVLWGWNPVVTKGYGGPMPATVMALRESGARLISVDPRYTETASVVDAQWMPLRPGTDAAVVIAMAYVMITEGLHDQAFLDRYTVGFDLYRRYVLGQEDGVPKTPAWAEAISGMPAQAIAGLAREYATAKPAAIIDGWSVGRTAYGEQFHRALATLACMTGNLGIAGGSAGCGYMEALDYAKIRYMPQFGAHTRMAGGNNPVDMASPLRKDSLYYLWERRKPSFSVPPPGHYYQGGPTTAFLNRVRVADAILKGRAGGYPADYKMLFLATINWANMYGNTNKIIQALKKIEFSVLIEQFMTATARYVDIILPGNTFAERNDLAAVPHMPFYGFRNKAIEPLGESKSMFEMASALAARAGIKDFSDKNEEEWIKEGARRYGIPDYEKFKREGIHRVTPIPFIAFEAQIKDPEHNPFATPSGKVEIYSQALADLGDPNLPPIPKYIETWEGRNDPLVKRYPLQLITTQSPRRTHSRFDQCGWARELHPQAVHINKADALPRGIRDGDMVKVSNDRGATVLRASVTELIMPGVVEINAGAWHQPDADGVDRGGCPNVLISDVPSPGGGLCSNTALVEVEKIHEEGR